MKDLEDEFGVTIFQRTTTGVIPTEAGEIILDKSRKISHLLGELRSEVEVRRNPQLEALVQAKQETAVELDVTEKALQEKSLEISQNYLSRLGEDLLRTDKLEDLISFLQTGEADTISGAIACYRSPKKDGGQSS